MKRLFFLILIMVLAISACKKEDTFEAAVIKDFGDPAVDGCGWVVEVATIIYKPQNLPSEFEIDNLDVNIIYDKLTNKADCGLAQNLYQEIYIKEIQAE